MVKECLAEEVSDDDDNLRSFANPNLSAKGSILRIPVYTDCVHVISN